MDSSQFLERYRNLSRDIQNELQLIQKNSQKLIDSDSNRTEINKIILATNNLSEAWQDFAGWILVSTLDSNTDIASNCASGLVSTQSKITRSIKKRERDIQSKGIKFDRSDVVDLIITTYISYFEQLLDLAIENAIKYSPKACTITISCRNEKNACVIEVDSIGPMIDKNEKDQLAQKGFRGKYAIEIGAPGGGQGLYNMKRIAELISINLSFIPSHKEQMQFGGLPHSNFTVKMKIPYEAAP